jgi:hydrogenase-4 component B
MLLHLLPIALLLACGLFSLLSSRVARLAHLAGVAGAAGASLLGLVVTIAALVRGQAASLALPWNASLGASFSVGFDPLTGFFLLPIYLLAAVCAVFGVGYLSAERGHHGWHLGGHHGWHLGGHHGWHLGGHHGWHLGGHHAAGSRLGWHQGDRQGPRLGSHWFFYCVLVASMALVTLARNAVLFLVAWELMSLSSWVLVTFEHEKEGVRQAGITYLVATQIGTAFLLVMFLLLGATAGASSAAGSAFFGAGALTPAAGAAAALDFSRFAGIGAPAAGAVFLLALIGFGTKAGIVPLHVWLPEAHPAAPSHVSALMSGVMIKTGIYGIVRVLTFLSAPAPWWGWTLAGVGAVSGVVGVLFALAQHDMKRLLAYHSVENIGIICLGLGVGLLGVSYGAPVVAVLGFAGGLLHVPNHALFKGLLFLGAGSAAHATGTRDIDHLGGLVKRMPLTAVAFLIGAAAISGLPPLNGFVSELLIFSGAFRAVALPLVSQAVAAAIVVGALALISGLAAACFTKAFGISFLGEPRSPHAADAEEAGAVMIVPMLILAAGCVAVGLLGPVVLSALTPLAAGIAGLSADTGGKLLAPVHAGLTWVSLVAAALAALVAVLVLLRFLLLRRRTSARAGTWDCGYVKPDARMQYTSSSFAQPLTGMFRVLLATRRSGRSVATLFPTEAALSTETPDVFSDHAFRPVLLGIGSLFSRLRWLQHGRLQLYVLYIFAALLALLVWRLS